MRPAVNEHLCHLAWLPIAALWTACALTGIAIGIAIDHFASRESRLTTHRRTQ